VEVVVDTYLGKAEDEGWSRFSGRLKDHPEVIVTFLFSDDNQRKEMRDALLARQKTTCRSARGPRRGDYDRRRLGGLIPFQLGPSGI